MLNFWKELPESTPKMDWMKDTKLFLQIENRAKKQKLEQNDYYQWILVITSLQKLILTAEYHQECYWLLPTHGCSQGAA